MGKKKESLEFEAAFTRLEEIVGKLESGDPHLDESLKLYQEGIELIQSCSKKLENAEQTIKQLTLENDKSSSMGEFDEEA